MAVTHKRLGGHGVLVSNICLGTICLLYTSDAADERSSVDLGGRRIIKKKKNTMIGTSCGNTVYNT